MSLLQAIVSHEATLRMGAFLLVLLLLALAQRLWPARGDARPAPRQLANLGLVVIDTAVLRLAFPLLAVALAMQVHARGGGLLGALPAPQWIEIVLAVLLLDAVIYWQHRLLHVIPPLWRLHRVHHSDLALDVTTGVRFHPLEIVVSMLVKLGVVALLGPHPAAVVMFEVLLSSASLFTHTDIAFPPRAERVLRALLVTPTMHRIHHSIRREETDSNYGFLLSWWDRIFGSYRARAIGPDLSMPLGLPPWRDARALGLGALLLQPFRAPPEPGADARVPPPEDVPHA